MRLKRTRLVSPTLATRGRDGAGEYGRKNHSACTMRHSLRPRSSMRKVNAAARLSLALEVTVIIRAPVCHTLPAQGTLWIPYQ